MSTDETPTLKTRLELILQEHRHRNLKDRTNEVTERLAEIRYLQLLGSTLFRIDTEVSDRLKELLQTARTDLQNNEYEALSTTLDALEGELKGERDQIYQRVAQRKFAALDQLQAVQRLNKRTEAVESGRITELINHFESMTEFGYLSGATFEARKQSVIEFAEFAAEEFDLVTRQVFSEFDAETQALVERLLSSEDIRLSDLSDSEIDELVGSELSEYLYLTLA